jgi:hypothetical protein
LIVEKENCLEQEYLDRRKYPRLFLAHSDDKYHKIDGAQFLWPLGGRSQVLDLSYSGIAISSVGFLDQVKIGDYIEAHLLLPHDYHFQIPVAVRVVRKAAQIIGFKIDSTNVEGRVKIDQMKKDGIVAKGLSKTSSAQLHANFKSDVWYHGPFDTNMFIWKTPDGAMERCMIEYDNSALVYEKGEFKVARTSSSAEESQGYVGPYLAKDFAQQKLALGQGWIERLQRLILQVSEGKEDLKMIFDILQQKKSGFKTAN